MHGRGCLAFLLFFLVLSPAPARAQRGPSDPIVLWGVQRGCEPDRLLNTAVQERLEALGSPVHVVEQQGQMIRRCVGPQCVALLSTVCAPALLAHATVLGGHVDDEYADGRYRARVRLWRVEQTPKGSLTYYRYERLDQPCPSRSCGDKLTSLVVTWMGQLLEDSTPNEVPLDGLDAAKPPYCKSDAVLPTFLCAPFNLMSRCGEEGGESSNPSSQLLCPLHESIDTGAKCDCAQPAACDSAARLACAEVVSKHSPTLRRILGGSLLAAGGGAILAGLLMTLNDYTSLTLRSDTSCSFSGMRDAKCFAQPGGIAASWVLGAGFVAGGALILLDPLRLFSDQSAPKTTQTLAPKPVFAN